MKLGGKVKDKLFGGHGRKNIKIRTQNESEGRKMTDHVCVKIRQLHIRKKLL